MADLLLLRSTSVAGIVVDHGILPRHVQEVLERPRFTKALPRDVVGDFVRAALKPQESVVVDAAVARTAVLLLDAALQKEPTIVLTIAVGGVVYDRASLTANGPQRFADQVAFVDNKAVLVERPPAPSSSMAWPAIEIEAGLDPIAAMYRANRPVAAWHEGRLVCRGRPSSWSSTARKRVLLKETDIVLELVPVAHEPAWRRLVEAVQSASASTTFNWRAA